MAYVSNVQELVKSDPSQVLEKFLIIRNEEDEPKNDLSSGSLSLIFLCSLEATRRSFTNWTKLAKEWGFFQVVNHGVATELLQEMKDGTAKFFELPLEEKNKIRMASGEFQGYGQLFGASQVQKMDWSDALLLSLYPENNRNLKFCPTEPEGYKEVIEAYSSEVKRVGEELLRSLSIIMGLEKHTLLSLHKELRQALRMNYIPPCSMPDKVLGLSPHSDTTTITILLQEDDVTGLQIQKEGEWVPVKPIPNALVVNVRDAIEIWSNGKYKSIEHRAAANKSKRRISYASFLCPHVDAEVEPFDNMVETSRKYKKVRCGDYLSSSLKSKLKGKAHIETAKAGKAGSSLP